MQASVRTYVFVAALVTAAAPAAAQGFVVDLGQQVAGKTAEISVSPGTTGVVAVTSKLPTRKYTVTTRVRVIPVPPLTSPFKATTATGDDLCVEGDTAAIVERALAALTAENDVAPKIDELRALAAACATSPDRIIEIVNAAARRLTVQELSSITLSAGQELEVRVLREDNQLWTVVFSAGPRGTWHTLYGFMFTPNFDEEYSTVAEGSQFRVTPQFTSRLDLKFLPAVFWSWMPASRENRSLNWSWTGGLAFDQARPAVFGGWSFAYNHNLALVMGGVFHQQKRLDANYNPEALPLVASALTPEQLSRQPFRFNAFVGLAFKFSSSPFAEPKKEEPKKEEPKPDDTKKEEPKKEDKKKEGR